MLGSVSGNASRAIGPAIGGIVVALAGPAAVFAINAVSFAGIIVALLVWKRPKQLAPTRTRTLRPGHHQRTGLRDTTVRFSAGSCCAPRFFCFPPQRCWRCCRWLPPARGTWEPMVTVWPWGPSVLAPYSVPWSPDPLRRRVSDNALLAASAAVYGLAPLGGRLAAIRCGDPCLDVVGDGLADHAGNVERRCAADIAAMGSGPRVVGVSAGLHRRPGNRRLCMGCRRHAGGTSHGVAVLGRDAGRRCPQRCRPSAAAEHRETERRSLHRLA